MFNTILKYVLIFPFFFCFITVCLSENDNHNAFINKGNGDVILFRKIEKSSQIHVLEDFFWLAFPDSLMTPGLKFLSVHYLEDSDCERTFDTLILYNNRWHRLPSNSCNSALLKNGEFLGFKRKLWELNAWKK